MVSHFPSSLFPSILNNTHIIGPSSIVSFAYEKFLIELRGIDLSTQPKKCVAWSLSSLPFNCDASSQFNTPSKGIKVFGVPSGTSSFKSSFIKDTLLKDVQHVDVFLKLDNVQVTFKILIHCYAQ